MAYERVAQAHLVLCVIAGSYTCWVSVVMACVCVSGAELQVNAKGYHNHRSGSLRFLVCVREREIDEGVLRVNRW